MGEEQPRIGEIAACIDVSAPTVTRMLDGLERDGLIERRPSTVDRRAVTIDLTEAGRAAELRVRRRIEAKRRRLFEALSPSDREGAARLLKGLAEGMDAL